MIEEHYIQIQKMTSLQLFYIAKALGLLAEKTQLEGDEFNDFDAIAKLEKSFVIAYQNKVGA